MLTPIRKFNKNVFNHLTMAFAGKTPTSFVIVRHVGRKSGKPYETPIIAIKRSDGFVIELTYGPNVDWFRNIKAANGCEILWHGQTFRINGVQTLDDDTGLAAFPQPFHLILTLLGRHDFALLTF